MFSSPKIKVPRPVFVKPKPLEPTTPLPAPVLSGAIGDQLPPTPAGQAQLLSQLRRPSTRRNPRTLLGG